MTSLGSIIYRHCSHRAGLCWLICFLSLIQTSPGNLLSPTQLWLCLLFNLLTDHQTPPDVLSACYAPTSLHVRGITPHPSTPQPGRSFTASTTARLFYFLQFLTVQATSLNDI